MKESKREIFLNLWRPLTPDSSCFLLLCSFFPLPLRETFISVYEKLKIISGKRQGEGISAVRRRNDAKNALEEDLKHKYSPRPRTPRLLSSVQHGRPPPLWDGRSGGRSADPRFLHPHSSELVGEVRKDRLPCSPLDPFANTEAALSTLLLFVFSLFLCLFTCHLPFDSRRCSQPIRDWNVLNGFRIALEFVYFSFMFLSPPAANTREGLIRAKAGAVTYSSGLVLSVLGAVWIITGRDCRSSAPRQYGIAVAALLVNAILIIVPCCISLWMASAVSALSPLVEDQENKILATHAASSRHRSAGIRIHARMTA